MKYLLWQLFFVSFEVDLILTCLLSNLVIYLSLIMGWHFFRALVGNYFT